MKKDIFKSKKLIIALVTSVVAISAIGIGLGVGLSGGGGDKKSQVPTISTLSDLKNKLENLPNDPLVLDTPILGSQSWVDLDDFFFEKVIKQPIFQVPDEFEVQYKLGDTLYFDGDLIIELRIRKKGDTNWTNIKPYTVSITGLTFVKLSGDFKSFVPKILERNNENGLLEIETNWSIARTKYFSGPYDESLYYMSSIRILPSDGEPIKKDGKSIIKFEVTTDQDKKYVIPIEFKIGQDTWNAKEALENMNTNPIYKENGIASINWKNLDDDFFSTIIEKEKPNLPNNTEIQYQISDAISNSENSEVGNLVVDFRYRRKDITNDLWTDIPSQYKLNIFLDKDLFDVQSALKGLSKADISPTMDIEAVTSWQEITDDVYSNVMKVDPPSIPASVEVQYQIPNAVTQDGNLVVNLRYKKTSSSDWHTITHTVKVRGLSIAKVKTYISDLPKKDYNTYKSNLSDWLSSGDAKLLTKENANLIFDFPEGEEYQEPIEFMYIRLTVEEGTVFVDDVPHEHIDLKFRVVYRGHNSEQLSEFSFRFWK